MYQVTTQLNPTSVAPLRRSAIGYRHRDAGRNLRAAAIAVLIVTLAFAIGYVL